MNRLEEYELESEMPIEDDSPRRFTKCMEVSVNPKFAFKPIIEVRKFLCGDFVASLKKEP